MAKKKPITVSLGFFLAILFILWVVSGLFPFAGVRAREQARRAQCMSNLKQFGIALNMYAQDHDEQFPPDLVTLWRDGYVTDPNLYFCPTLPDRPDFQKLTGKKEVEEAIRKHLHYSYIPGIKATDPAESILAFDEEYNHRCDGGNYLFIDGHVTWYVGDKIKKHLEKQLAELAAEGRDAKVIRPPWSRYPEPPAGHATRAAAKAVATAVPTVIVIAIGVGLILLLRWDRRRQAAKAPPG